VEQIMNVSIPFTQEQIKELAENVSNFAVIQALFILY
jgi:hypothetical protein